jgi:branched-chain amino acid transport system ATP-binding protein
MAPVTQAAPALRVDRVNLAFGGVRVLRDVSFDVAQGEILALIGPNGAGKTSLINVMTGVYVPQGGDVMMATGDGPVSMVTSRSHSLVHHGLTRTFQNLQVVPGLTVLDNVLVGRHWLMTTGSLAAMLGGPRARREEREQRRVCLEILEFMGLGHTADQLVGTLPYGVQKRIELARALATRPRVLLLDEPAAGLNDEETAEMATLMRLIRDSGTCTQVLIEHDMNMVMSTADRLVVLNFGEVLATGSADEIRHHPEVMSAYLGTSLK